MTRKDKAAIREAKKQAKIALRIENKEDRQEIKAWDKMIRLAKEKGALIES